MVKSIKIIQPMDFSRLIFERCCDISLQNQLDSAGYKLAKAGVQTPNELSKVGVRTTYALSIEILAIMLDLQATAGTENWISLNDIAGKLGETKHINYQLSPDSVRKITKQILVTVLQNQGRPFQASFLGKDLTIEESKPTADSDGILVRSKPDKNSTYRLTDSAYRFMYANDEVLIKKVLSIDVMAWLGEKAIKDNNFVQTKNILGKTYQLLLNQEEEVNKDIKRIKESVDDYSMDDLEKRVASLRKQLKDYADRLKNIENIAIAALATVQSGSKRIDDEQNEALIWIVKRLEKLLLEKENAWAIIGRLNNTYIKELVDLRRSLRIAGDPVFSFSREIYEPILADPGKLEGFASYLAVMLVGKPDKEQKQVSLERILDEPIPYQAKKKKAPIKLKKQDEIKKKAKLEEEKLQKEKIAKYMTSIEAVVNLLADRKKHKLSELAGASEANIASDTWPLIYQSLAEILRNDDLQLPKDPGAYLSGGEPQVSNMLTDKILETTGQKLNLKTKRCPVDDLFSMGKDKMTDMWLQLSE